MKRFFNQLCSTLGYCMICAYTIAAIVYAIEKIVDLIASKNKDAIENESVIKLDPNDPDRFKEVI